MFLHELNDGQKEAFICLAHNVVVSDGELSSGEQLMMEQLRREIDLSVKFEPHYIPLEGIDKTFDTRGARTATVIALVRLGYADGAFEIEEQFLLQEVCRIFDISKQGFTLIENWVRRLIALEKEARSLML
jgi:tellurite resistance protein